MLLNALSPLAFPDTPPPPHCFSRTRPSDGTSGSRRRYRSARTSVPSRYTHLTISLSLSFSHTHTLSLSRSLQFTPFVFLGIPRYLDSPWVSLDLSISLPLPRLNFFHPPPPRHALPARHLHPTPALAAARFRSRSAGSSATAPSPRRPPPAHRTLLKCSLRGPRSQLGCSLRSCRCSCTRTSGV